MIVHVLYIKFYRSLLINILYLAMSFETFAAMEAVLLGLNSTLPLNSSYTSYGNHDFAKELTLALHRLNFVGILVT